MAEDLLEVTTDTVGTTDVVYASGEIDISSADLLWQQLADRAGGERRLVVDLSGVTFLDSTGLGVLVAAHKQIAAAKDGAALDLVVSNQQIHKVFEITGLTSLFHIHPNLDAALA